MPSDLIISKFQKRFDALNETLHADRKVILHHQKILQETFSRILRPLHDMEKAFKEKPPGVALKAGAVEYQDFDKWATDFVEPITGFKKRQLYYAIHMSRHLLDKVTDADLEEVGIEKAKELSRYAETKGNVPKELVEKAKASTVEELHTHVKQQIYKGNPDHEERSAWETLEIEGPRTHISKIRNFLQLLRRQEGHKPSDAELLADVISVEYTELQEAEARRRQEISGLSAGRD